MKKLKVLGFLTLFLSACATTPKEATFNLPDGWRLPTSEDAIDDWARFNSPSRVEADFNGDGKTDRAQILLKNNSSTGYRLIVDISDGDNIKRFNLDQNDSISAQSMAIELLDPSNEVWDSACEKGYWECQQNEIRKFKISKPSIQFCYIESACVIYMWSDRNKNFTKIPLSD
ncbi:hypothetical protein [Acinetobacter larvae]|uniref:Lipoprotein n=1 Tax=Acinetobacter larvae TaxID=1789224 RepID=A0A1B2LZE4_9GAMM|nr:hypothetical protein [Acinetobacter larvae]AOA58279.1 hypothetical protein BFG52_07855 [Acinetobacter larvae]